MFYSLRLSVAFFHYALCNESFTALYCVNVDKPEMKCNGKCHLLKETKESLPEKNATTFNQNLHENIHLFFSETVCFQLEVSEFLQSKNTFASCALKLNKVFIEPTFPPPDYLI
ncbi:hypothetical protein GO491_03295 [Flavobacteriaceae bacterium Ap0902]|nr:hypothetical protein [Flavobacteriaceae bacterium Ap0902]